MEKLPFDPHETIDELTSKINKMELKEKKKPISKFERCLLESDWGGICARISEVDGLTIRYFNMEPKILIKVECKAGLVFRDKMQIALLMSFRKETDIELFVNDELQVEGVQSSPKI